jgi:hypothetical protein
MSEEERLAKHESVHAIVAHLLGRRVLRVRVNSSDGGDVQVEDLSTPPPCERCATLDAITVLIAPAAFDCAPPSSVDWDEAHYKAFIANGGAYAGGPQLVKPFVGLARARAQMLARNPSVAAMVRRVTEALLREGELDADRFLFVVESTPSTEEVMSNGQVETVAA